MLRMSVTRSWRAGWQPAELTRHAGRELSQEHVSVAVDMIAAEMSGYPAATVDQRWAAQVTAARALSVAARRRELVGERRGLPARLDEAIRNSRRPQGRDSHRDRAASPASAPARP